MLRARLPQSDNTCTGNTARSGGMLLSYSNSKDGKRLVQLPSKMSLRNGNSFLLQDFMSGWLNGLPSMIMYVLTLFIIHLLTLWGYQSVDVVESPELHELLLFISPHLNKVDIPHRTKLSELIMVGFKQEYLAMLKDIEVSVHHLFIISSLDSGNRTLLGGYHSQVIYGPVKTLNYIWPSLLTTQPSPQSLAISLFVLNSWPSVNSKEAIVESISARFFLQIIK